MCCSVGEGDAIWKAYKLHPYQPMVKGMQFGRLISCIGGKCDLVTFSSRFHHVGEAMKRGRRGHADDFPVHICTLLLGPYMYFTTLGSAVDTPMTFQGKQFCET
jgi:hypothetical protein